MAPGVRWPKAVDYQTALQNPALCFNDPALQRGAVATDSLGLPLAVSGNVAVVFHLRRAQGDVALRCFTRQRAAEAMQRRYEALQAHRGLSHLPALVPSRFRPAEMLVGGQRYGLVEMDWVQGRHLHRFVAEHRGEAGVLHTLADQWRILMARLRTARIAHGDLADGNVLIDQRGRLRLIDYDAAYVPALRAAPPGELGKPNYQHPERLRPDGPDYGYYAENMDAFPALVVYLSLRALANDSTLWDRYHTGENLLFVQRDYEHPGYAPLWSDLRSGGDPEVRTLTDVLERFCRAPLAHLPDLEDALRGRAPRPMQARAEVVAEAGGGEEQAPLPARRLPDRPAQPSSQRTRAAGAGFFRRGRRRAAGLGVVAVLAAVVALWGSRSAPGPGEQSAPAQQQVVAVAPAELAGFYTGYATMLDGTREALALTLAPPDTAYADGDVRLPYSINWKSHQSGGIGHYNAATGHLDLENHYELYVASAGNDEVVLASLARQESGPVVKVNKRKRL